MKTIFYCLKTAISGPIFAVTFLLWIAVSPLRAQNKESFQAELGIDMVSQNVWRGIYQAGASIQPSLSAGYRNFELYVWGTTDFQSALREIDFTFSYTFRGFTIGVTDYCSEDGTIADFRSHQFEGNLKYTFNKTPLSLEWNTVFWGEERPYSFSSYVAISYVLELPFIDFDLSAGFTPWKNKMLGTERFAVTNLSVTAGKQICIKPSFTISSGCTLLYNPDANQLYFIARIGFIFSKS